LKAAVVLAANGNAFHPVREYLSELVWDGVARCDSLFVDYLGSEDKPYSRHVARLMLVAAVARIFEPGIKFDTAVILEGLQGRGKSTFIRTLGRYWSAELEGDFSDRKQMIELMQGKWLIEVPELSGFSRTDVRSIKAFISCGSDRARLAYARRAGEFPRQSIFIGSTNDREYLRDASGGRRFLPIECHVEMIDIPRLRQNVDQIWAEAVVIYRQMRVELPLSTGDLPLYLADHEAADEAAKMQESRRVESAEDALVGQIAQWLDKPIASGDITEDGEGKLRDVVCLVQVWREGLQRDPNAYAGANQQALGRAMRGVSGWKQMGELMNFPAPYGRQRYYARIGSTGRLSELAA
jgi:predicted P-loop ATPase